MRGDIVSGLVAVQMGGGGNVTVSDIHEVFMKQDIVASADIVGPYRAEVRKMPPETMYTTYEGWSDYKRDDGTWLFVPWSHVEYDLYCVGYYRGDEYIGIRDIMTLNTVARYYDYNSTYTGNYLKQKIIDNYGNEVKAAEPIYTYNSGVVHFKGYLRRDETYYNEQGEITENNSTEYEDAIIYTASIGEAPLKFLAISPETYAVYQEEAIRMVNAKYHEIND